MLLVIARDISKNILKFKLCFYLTITILYYNKQQKKICLKKENGWDPGNAALGSLDMPKTKINDSSPSFKHVVDQVCWLSS